MDAIFLSRLQFALTVGFHYLFPPLSIGLAWFIFWILTRYLRSGDETFRTMARFWVALLGLTFAVGAATGITMEFQFGTNWANYSRFVGDVFGAPLAAEGILAFFLESTFLGMLIFGDKRLSPRVYWFSSLMVAIGATISAFFIVAANSWQQTPAGFQIKNGRAELTDIFAAIFNPSTAPRFMHTITGALLTGGMFVLGISAYYLLKKKHVEFAKRSLRMALLITVAGAMLQLPLGHWHAVQVWRTQPTKLAAFEGLFETQTRAPALLFGIPDAEAGKTHLPLAIPGGLSFLVNFDLNQQVRGLKDFPKDLWPPLTLTFYPFHLMVMLGMYFIGLSALGLLLWFLKKIDDHKLFLWLALLSIPLPFIANELGWIAAEVGRQPWVVWGLLKTSTAISPSVSYSHILSSIILFSVVYALLFGLWIFLLRKKLHTGPEPLEPK